MESEGSTLQQFVEEGTAPLQAYSSLFALVAGALCSSLGEPAARQLAANIFAGHVT